MRIPSLSLWLLRVPMKETGIFLFLSIPAKKGLRKVAVTGYSEETLKRFFESEDDPRPTGRVLRELYEQYKPKKIGLSFNAKRGVQRSLTYDTYNFLAEKMGPEAVQHFVPAAPLIEEYLDTRIPEEFETYESLVQLTDLITRRGLSNKAICPGKTTVGDLRRWFYDQLSANGVDTWFQPDLRIQRKGMPNPTSRGFLAVSKEDVVIQRGDVVHVDFGITYMGLNTDWQKEAYVLLPGEKDAPEGLKRALKNTNELQDVLTTKARPGLLPGDVYNATMDAMEKKRNRSENLQPSNWQSGPRSGPQYRLPVRGARGYRGIAGSTVPEGVLYLD